MNYHLETSKDAITMKIVVIDARKIAASVVFSTRQVVNVISKVLVKQP